MFKALLISVFLVCCSTAVANDASILITAESSSQTLIVKKMNCGGCAKKVKRSLAQVEGIKEVITNSKERTVKIEIADASKFDINKAIVAIKKSTGWVATVK